MESFVQSLENLVNSHRNSFDKGVRLNKQLKLLEIYIKNLYTNPEKYSIIETKNQHFQEYTCEEFDNVLKVIGFCVDNEQLIFLGSLDNIPLEFIMKQLGEHRYLSFAEIVEIIEKGETPPGIKQIIEQPVGAEIVVSDTIRPKKPWNNE